MRGLTARLYVEGRAEGRWLALVGDCHPERLESAGSVAAARKAHVSQRRG